MSNNMHNTWNEKLTKTLKCAQELQSLLSEGDDTNPKILAEKVPADFKHITDLADYINKNMSEMVAKNPGNQKALQAITTAYATLSKPVPKSINTDTAGINTIISSIQALSASCSSQKDCGSKDCKDKNKKCA